MPSNSYSQVFGGETINPAQLSYIAYTTSVALELVWPLEAPPDANVAADKVDIHTNGTNIAITLPPADQASVGQDVLFRNVGSDTFYVYDQDGVEVAQLDPSTAWYVVLIDNSTAAGEWYAIQFGTGTSEATAASLAGAGLRANLSLLDQNLPTTDLLDDYAVTVGDRATVLQNDGGAVTWTFASAATLGNGFFVYVINTGSGSIVLTAAAGQTIDDAATKTLAPTESLIVFSDGSNLHTLGYGRSIVNTVTGVSINVAGSGTLTLTSPEIAAQVQDWSGTLTGNRILDYGGGVGYWFVWNNSTGAFSVTARVNGLDAGVAVTQGNYSILRSNGTNMEIAFTATTGTVTQVATTADLTGGPITTTGTLGLSNTGVVAGTYGSPSSVPVETIDSKGRTTSATNTPIAITGSQVTDLTSIIAAAVLAAIPVGTVWANITTTLPIGWLYAGGGTIGNAASNATVRANADTSSLFTALWNGYSNTILPIYNSAGAPTTRGASAAADYAANKAISIPDLRGRSLFGRDDMNGTVANRVTNAGSGIPGTTLGASGGDQLLQQHNHGVTDSGHIHAVTDPGHTHTVSISNPGINNSDSGGGNPPGPTIGQPTSSATTGVTVNSHTTGVTVNNAGSGAGQNMPPAWISNYIVKYA